MKDVNEKFQQQILFDEVDTNGKTDNLPITEEQVLFDNEDWLPESEETLVEDEVIVSSTKPRWLWRIVGSVFVGVVAVETFTFFQQGFSQSPILAAMYGVLLFGLSAIVGSTAIREYSALRQSSQGPQQAQARPQVPPPTKEL